MIAVAAGVKVLVATKPVDFRKGADGLVALVREALGPRRRSPSRMRKRTKKTRRKPRPVPRGRNGAPTVA